MKKIVSSLLLFLCCGLIFSGCGKETGYTLPEYNHEALTALNQSITAEEKAAYDEIITTEVAVIGSDPEGVAAAVAAGRKGMDTRLIDFDREKVGGLYTLGWLNMIDMNYTKSGSTTSINQGIFAEVLEANDNKTSFTPQHMTTILNNLLKKANVNVKTDYDKDYQVLMKDSAVDGVVLHSEGKTILLKAVKYIDSTQNADIMIDAGAKYYDGMEELGLKGERGCDTLVFQISGVDWNTIKKKLQEDDNPDTGAEDSSAWGYSEIKNCPIDDEDIYMRGPNIGRQKDGTILLNGLQIFHMDIHDEAAMEAMRERVVNVLNNILIPYMRENFEGWENAALVDVAPEFYIRESYHLLTVERLESEDIFQSNFSENTIALGSYPIDLQGREKGLYGLAVYGTSPYGIPFGAMVSEQCSNILVASRCAGYSTVAAGSARTVPVGMSLGEAAGVSAAYAVVNEIGDFNTIANESTLVDDIQSLLKTDGANLDTYPQTENQKTTAKSDYYNDIAYLRDQGLLTFGYSDDYQLKEDATRETLNRIAYSLISESPYAVPTISTDILPDKTAFSEEMCITIINQYLNSSDTTTDQLVEKGILRQEVADAIKGKTAITNEVFYGVMADMVRYMESAGDTYYKEKYKTP